MINDVNDVNDFKDYQPDYNKKIFFGDKFNIYASKLNDAFHCKIF
jgi:hypothetical protein